MKILITGHKGFIGQHAVEKCQSLNIPYITYEWGEPYPDLLGVTHAMHFGAISSTTETDVEKVMRQNYDCSLRLLVDCDYRSIHMQWSSSASVYGLGDVFTEDAPVDPRTPYAWSKYLFERFCNKNKGLNIPVQGFRYFNVYGDKGEDHKGDQASPYHKFRKQATETGVVRIFEGSENYLRDFIHVDQVLDTQFKFLDIKASGVWNIGTGVAKSFRTVAEEVVEKHGGRIEEILMPDNLKNSYQKYTCADLTKLNQTL